MRRCGLANTRRPKKPADLFRDGSTPTRKMTVHPGNTEDRLFEEMNSKRYRVITFGYGYSQVIVTLSHRIYGGRATSNLLVPFSSCRSNVAFFISRRHLSTNTVVYKCCNCVQMCLASTLAPAWTDSPGGLRAFRLRHFEQLDRFSPKECIKEVSALQNFTDVNRPNTPHVFEVEAGTASIRHQLGMPVIMYGAIRLRWLAKYDKIPK